ncbi:MAG: class I SAM-dependent methyltransferase [Bacteroidetes bacterium]|nr:class I SAM-dependent methyltransferase [Bacteroidota bacterium]
MVKLVQPDKKKYIVTEGIDYSQTGNKSIWGNGDFETLKLLKREKIKGTWLNLAAGDGRYNNVLLEKADNVVVSDIDGSALNKLYQVTHKSLQEKISLKVFNITKRFPFENNQFDGIFCAGSLHLFPESILKNIFSEIGRILKSNGKIIIDFATDVKRVCDDGGEYIKGNEPRYTKNVAKQILTKLLSAYDLVLKEYMVPDEIIHAPQGFDYKFSCNFFLMIGTKKCLV